MSPGWSHSRPVRDSQPSGLRRSLLCSSRQAMVSFCQAESCANEESERIAQAKKSRADLVERDCERMENYSAG